MTTPLELSATLSKLLANKISLSVMIWGPPGIGKSSIVAQVAKAHDMEMIDVRLSQLAPTDLRGLPVPDEKDQIARWYPPEFLPRTGRGVLFMDELNMAPPAVQGIAQQLILDRKVGSYTVPDGWVIWAAGNRKEDRASVFDTPAPLANRFLHLDVVVDFESFKTHAIQQQFHEQIIAFLSYRPVLLHKLDTQRPAWPSPRSWSMAHQLHKAGMSVEPAVGGPTAEEFRAYLAVYDKLASLDDILHGKGRSIQFPAEPSLRYAVTVGLSLRSMSAEEALNAFRWLADRAQAEWQQLFVANLLTHLEARGLKGIFAIAVQQDKRLADMVNQNVALAMGGGMGPSK